MKPMLAVEADLRKVKYPCYVQPKLDGIRVVVRDGLVLSRSLKPIRNEYVQELFGHLQGLDGELIVGDPTAPDVFQKTTSGVMSKAGEPDVKLHVFDMWDKPNKDYEGRCRAAGMLITPDCVLVDTVECNNEQELTTIYDDYVKQGYEGVMLRNPDKPYKFGRATKNSQELLKLKPFEDDEFVVVGFTERMHNANEATVNALGNIERSSAKAGKVPTGMLGALEVLFQKDDKDPVKFEVGTGFTEEQRREIWNNRDKYLGKLAKVRYQEIGMKDLPRFGSFKGFRDKDDL